MGQNLSRSAAARCYLEVAESFGRTARCLASPVSQGGEGVTKKFSFGIGHSFQNTEKGAAS